MTPDAQMFQALQAPRALEDLLRVLHGLHAEGLPQAEAYASLERLLQRTRDEMGEELEGVVLQVMDVCCGFCRPEHKLWDEELPRRHAPDAGLQVV